MNKKLSTKEMTLVAMCAALMAIFSQIAIPLPFSTVPLTLQSFGVICIAVLLGGRLGTLSILLWVIIGAIGVPVYSGFSGGVGILVGPTGGYIWGFLLTSAVVGYAASKNNKVILIIGGIVGQILQYVLGVLQLQLVLNLDFQKAMITGVYPFVVKDFILLFIALMIVSSLRNRLSIEKEL